MAWGSVTVGGITFREELEVAETGGGDLTIRGQESHPPQTQAAVRAAHRNVLGLDGAAAVPVVFTDKTGLTGFYRVASATSTLYQFASGSVVSASWELSLARLGGSSDVEFESRVPTIARASEVAGTASFWHAPPGVSLDYFTGATVPAATVTRTGSDGPIDVYRGIPAGVAPRWTVAAADYMKGSSRITLDGFRHAGADTPPHASWSVSNSLLEVRSTSGAEFEVAVVAADGSAKSVKGWAPTVNGTTLTARPEFTVLRNDPEEVIVRLSYPANPGRMTVDLSLRRGARFVTGVIKRHSAVTLGVARTAAEAAGAVTGGLRATSADADGNRFVVGSTRTVTTATDTAAISKASTTRLDFFVGHEVGASPATGDAFAELFAAYLGTQGERVRSLRR